MVSTLDIMVRSLAIHFTRFSRSRGRKKFLKDDLGLFSNCSCPAPFPWVAMYRRCLEYMYCVHVDLQLEYRYSTLPHYRGGVAEPHNVSPNK